MRERAIYPHFDCNRENNVHHGDTESTEKHCINVANQVSFRQRGCFFFGFSDCAYRDMFVSRYRQSGWDH
jgi:hypothetical protein